MSTVEQVKCDRCPRIVTDGERVAVPTLAEILEGVVDGVSPYKTVEELAAACVMACYEYTDACPQCQSAVVSLMKECSPRVRPSSLGRQKKAEPEPKAEATAAEPNATPPQASPKAAAVA